MAEPALLPGNQFRAYDGLDDRLGSEAASPLTNWSAGKADLLVPTSCRRPIKPGVIPETAPVAAESWFETRSPRTTLARVHRRGNLSRAWPQGCSELSAHRA